MSDYATDWMLNQLQPVGSRFAALSEPMPWVPMTVEEMRQKGDAAFLPPTAAKVVVARSKRFNYI